ncbi:MAG: c-type cytochrome [Planctomycetes bacterium]|nr:c-type cytochrome [Planctomycetota bacterium]
MSRSRLRALALASGAVLAIAAVHLDVEAGVPPEVASGLALTIEPLGGAKPGSLASDTRRARLLALHVPRREAPTPFTRPGAFRATWRGALEIPARDDYTFAFQGSGRFRLEIDGAVVLEAQGRHDEPLAGAAVRLRKGARQLVAVYEAPLSGQGDVRVLWSSRRFGSEPIPPTAFAHDPADPALVAGELRRAGRMLFATRRCGSCHAPGAAAMPELAMRGPDLAGAGDRLESAWLAAWIRAPRALRPDARMPHIAAVDDPDGAVRDLAAFVAAQRGAAAPVGDGAEGDDAEGDDAEGDDAEGDARAGARVWADLGCFACHGFADDGPAGAPPTWRSLDLAGAKFRPGAMARFLREPARHDPFIRMPDLALSDTEARDLEAFVRSRSAGSVPAVAPGDPARGAQRYAELGCASCHAVPAPAPVQRDLASLCADPGALTRGCLAADAGARGSAPDFGLTDDERAALRAFAADEGVASLGRAVAIEVLDRQLDERACVACHQVDGQTSWWLARAGRLESLELPERAARADGHVEVAQLRPALTQIGDKLRRDWTAGFVAGRIESPRPWLHARMPRLPGLADVIATGFAHAHGHAADPEPVAVDPARAAVGRGLIEQQGGFGCVTCHAVFGRQPAALFEVQGIDLGRVAERLRPAWYRRWMLDPERIEPAAKMPRFATDAGRTALEPFDGDAAAQFDAIWHWLHAGAGGR